MATPPVAPTADQLKIHIDPSNYATQLPSLADVQKQYGLQDPATYANQIASANAQTKLDAINAQKAQVQQDLTEGQKSLDVNFFQQFRNQKEAQAQRGLNAGIAAQQNTQLDMSRQAQLAGLLRDANRQTNDLSNQARTVDVQKQAEALQIQHNELQSQIDLAFKKGDFLQAENARRMQLDIEKENSRVSALQTNYNNANTSYWNNVDQQFKQQQFSYQKQLDAIQQSMANRDYAFKVQQANADNAFRNSQLAYQKTKDAYNKQAAATSQANAVNKLISDSTIAARTNGSNISSIMRGLMNANNDGLLTGKAYTDAVNKVNQAYTESSYFKKNHK